MKNLKKEQKVFLIAMILLLAVQLVVLVWYGSRKNGFHEDELYTYYSTNKTAGLFVEDRQWIEQEQLLNEFVVLEGEGFRYSVVKMMQSWDVHPPLYYYIIHTVSSLTPGVFSKWQGICVNLLAYVLSFWLLAKVVFTVVTTTGDAGETKEVHTKARCLTFLICFFWGFSSAVISGVMFIRMYQWLTVFVLLCLWLHVRALKEQKFGLKFLMPLSVTVFLGFLTQYYYIIFHVFLGAGFCFLMLKHKKIKEMFAYAGACAVGLGAAILYYPSALSHIFRGYRGTEAVSEFMNTSNTWDRLRFFVGLFDDYVMDNTLSIWLLILCLLAITAGYLKKKNRIKGPIFKESVGLMIFSAAGYFFTISQTALLLGETSNRYELPIYGVLCCLFIYGIWSLTERCFRNKGTWEKRTRMMAGVLLCVLFVMNMTSLLRGKVFFLYEGEKEVTEFVRENKDVPVVVFYNEGGKDHVWWLSDKLMESERFYLVSQQNPEPVTDENITQSDSILVYMSECEDEVSFLESLIQNNPNLSTYREVAQKEVWTLYEVS
ncbi:MAG: hypothetical protein IJ409_02520 [Lachnospiraceae bacterium]|nr:hypothetical protein [Lachnospiraceae bacterium]MBQ8596641.1 hypothetical protein [Lachnospiraceae bacterium]